MTVDHFRQHFVRYIVGSCHNHPHRGIEGRTPLQVWQKLAGPAYRPHLPSEMQMRAAFGTRTTRVVGKKGVEFHGVFYTKHVWPPSPKPDCEVMGMLLRAWEGKAALRRPNGSRTGMRRRDLSESAIRGEPVASGRRCVWRTRALKS